MRGLPIVLRQAIMVDALDSRVRHLSTRRNSRGSSDPCCVRRARQLTLPCHSALEDARSWSSDSSLGLDLDLGPSEAGVWVSSWAAMCATLERNGVELIRQGPDAGRGFRRPPRPRASEPCQPHSAAPAS